MNKTLVAYFSATRATAKLAKTLAKAIGADLHEIKPATPYTTADLDWTNKIDNIDQYERIFVGFPIWWYVAPTIINTFLEQYDLTNKKIIPFATSDGSGMGHTNNELAPSCQGAILDQGRRFDANTSTSELKEWAEQY